MALRLVGEVTLDGAGFERGLNRIGQSAAANLKSFVVGAFGVYGVQQAIQRTVESCSELVNTSSKLGMTVEQLQVLRQAAKEAGVEFETMVTAVNKLAAIRENILQGGKGSAQQLAALGRLGVTPEDVRTKTAADIMQGPIAQTVKTVNPADIANDLKQIFSKASRQVIPVLKTNFDELGRKMKMMGMIVDDVTARKLKLFGDEVGLVSGIIMSGLAPWLVKLGQAAFKLAEDFAVAGTFYGTLLADWAHGIFKGSSKDAAAAGKQTQDDWEKTWHDFISKATGPANVPPPTIPAEIEAEKKAKVRHEREWKTPEDSLISVGNFLGTGKGAINNIAQQQLDVSREQLEIQKSSDAALKDLTHLFENFGSDDDDLGD